MKAMDCPFCKYPDTKVIRTTSADDGLAIKRRRECPRCGRRFTTTESIELQIIKRDGSLEPFSRVKVINGVRRASQNLDIKDEDLNRLGREVEEDLKARGKAEITSDEVGKAILKPLRDLNDVAYLRFASVYHDFSSISDFQDAIDELERYHASKGNEADDADSAGATGVSEDPQKPASSSGTPADGAAAE